MLVGLPVLIDVITLTNNNLNTDFAIPQSLILIFYSSLVLVTSYAIYKIFCPKVIQRYDSMNQYLDAEQSKKERAFPDKKKEIVLAHLTSAQERSKEDILALDKEIRNESDQTKRKALENDLVSILDPLYPGCIQRYLIKKWNILLKRAWFALAICLVLNAASVLMILFAFTSRILKVVNYTF